MIVRQHAVKVRILLNPVVIKINVLSSSNSSKLTYQQPKALQLTNPPMDMWFFNALTNLSLTSLTINNPYRSFNIVVK
jgi:hypothetical protein